MRPIEVGDIYLDKSNGSEVVAGAYRVCRDTKGRQGYLAARRLLDRSTLKTIAFCDDVELGNSERFVYSGHMDLPIGASFGR